ncbi:hypothetical protein BaRGS_00013749 [Batillaria attramentaria]|uniref:Uncharacterized protein n=1 Tax=Batillaria attramentaria TaxID=370345 RepID=A0ABD0L6X2_9CAEN
MRDRKISSLPHSPSLSVLHPPSPSHPAPLPTDSNLLHRAVDSVCFPDLSMRYQPLLRGATPPAECVQPTCQSSAQRPNWEIAFENIPLRIIHAHRI